MSTAINRLSKRKARSEDVPLCWDPNDAATLNRLQDAALDARKASDRQPTKADLRGEADEADAAVDELLQRIPTATFHLVACGPKKMESLMGKHPPTKDQQQKHREAQDAAGVARPTSLQFNQDTYPPALVAKCCKRIVLTHQERDDDDPDGPQPDENGVVTITGDDITPELFKVLFELPAWSTMDIGVLFGTCQILNQAASAVNRDLVDRLGNG